MCLLAFLLVACGGRDNAVDEPILDATRLNETAVSLVTMDFAATLTHVPTETPTPTLTRTPIPTLDRTRPPIQTPTGELVCNLAAAGQPIDITIPDDTKLAPGTSFSKTWRIKNVGACTWTRLYTVTFFSGNSLSAQYTNYLQEPVEPGEIVDLTVDMVAPERIGLYQSNWMLSDPDGAMFGIGPHGDAPFWVRIEVVLSVTDTPQPTPTLTPTPVVYVSGEADLTDGDELDLDTATLNPSVDSQGDILYQLGGTPIHLLTPINDMEWGLYGDTEPGLINCTNTAINDNSVGFTEVPLDAYYCYQTSEGLRGWLRFEAFASGKLTVSFVTWATP